MGQQVLQYQNEHGSGALAVVPGAAAAAAPLAMVTPVGDRGIALAQIKNGVRMVTLAKDAAGKLGLAVQAIDKGVFVAFVWKVRRSGWWCWCGFFLLCWLISFLRTRRRRLPACVLATRSCRSTTRLSPDGTTPRRSSSSRRSNWC